MCHIHIIRISIEKYFINEFFQDYEIESILYPQKISTLIATLITKIFHIIKNNNY